MQRLVLLITLVISSFVSFAQCPTTPLILTSQAEVDAFAVNYPGCTEIDDLTIEGSDITNLDGLTQIEAIGTTLKITYNPILTDVSGLNDIQFISEEGELWFRANEILESIDGFLNDTQLSTLIIVGNASLMSLEGLETLVSVEDISIGANHELVDLTGLNGIVSLVNVSIGSNDNLDSFNGLQNVQFAEDSVLSINNNPLLTSLHGFVANGSIIDGLSINDNAILTNLNGLEGIIHLQNSLTIKGNDSLENISDLGGIVTSGFLSGMRIEDNPSLTSLEGLAGIRYVHYHLTIAYNDALTNLDGLEIYDVGEAIGEELGYFTILGNDTLSDISALNSLIDPSMGHLAIQDNPLLSLCSEQKICEYLSNGGTGYISNNAPGCNSVAEVEAACGFDCPIGYVELNSQVEVDDFAINYPNCTSLMGLTINGADIVDLTPLSALINIERELRILNNTNLTSLNGFQGIINVGELIIDNNQSLTNLIGLDNLNTICLDPGYPSLEISNNPNLISIETLSGVSSSCLTSLAIRNNNALHSLEGLENFGVTVGGIVVVSENDSLTSLIGLSGLDYVDYGLFIMNNLNLVTLNGLDNLQTVPDEIVIEGNSALESISFSNVITTNSWRIKNNQNLTSISEVKGLSDPSLFELINNPLLTDIVIASAVGNNLFYDIHIENNEMLADLSFLENVEIIHAFRIIDNDQLVSFNGLEGKSFLKFFTSVVIDGNALLTDLTAMEAIELIGIPELQIKNNPLLSICSIESICNYLDQGGMSDIANNASGCDTVSEVEDACNSLSVSEVNLDDNVLIYPNPTSEILQIKLSENIQFESITLYSMLGEQLLFSSEKSIEVSNLSEGIYFITIQTSNGSITKKIVKE